MVRPSGRLAMTSLPMTSTAMPAPTPVPLALALVLLEESATVLKEVTAFAERFTLPLPSERIAAGSTVADVVAETTWTAMAPATPNFADE